MISSRKKNTETVKLFLHRMETKGNYLKTRTKKQSETEDIMYPLLFLSPRIPHIKGIEKTINSEVGKQRDCKSEMHF